MSFSSKPMKVDLDHDTFWLVLVKLKSKIKWQCNITSTIAKIVTLSKIMFNDHEDFSKHTLFTMDWQDHSSCREHNSVSIHKKEKERTELSSGQIS